MLRFHTDGHRARSGPRAAYVGAGIPVEGSSVISFRCGFCACKLPTMQWDVLANGTIAFRFPPNTGIHSTGAFMAPKNNAAKRLVLGAGPDRCLFWFGIKSSTILVHAGDPRQLVFTELIGGRRAVNSVPGGASATAPDAVVGMHMERGVSSLVEPARQQNGGSPYIML